MKKLLAILLALTMVLGVALTVQADKPTFSISITSVTGGPGSDPPNTYTNPITLSGNASAIDFPGQLTQYQVQIDWGDGVVDIDSNVTFIPSGNDFAGTWSSDPSHTYANGTYTIKVKLYHVQPPGNEAGDAQAAPIIIVVVNNAPEVSNIPDQTIAEGATFAAINLDDYVSDVDNTDAEMTWSFTGNTDLTVSIDASRVATIGIPNVDWNGAETITFRATDPGSLYDEDQATFTVTAVNDAPVVSDIPDQTIAEGASFATISLDDYVTDVDNTDAQMTWSFTGNTDLTVSIDASRVATIGIPNVDWNGAETITIRATDPGSLYDEDQATFTVTAVNDAPVVSDIPDQTIAEGATFTTINLDDYVSDVDNTDAEMTWTYSGNVSLSVTITNRVATIGIPHLDWNGAETITFTATDPGSLYDEDQATFTVTAVNDPPVAVNDAYSTSEDTVLNVAAPGVLVNDTDVDLDPLTAVLVGNVSNGALTLYSNGSFIYTPNADFNGADTFTYKAYDGIAYSGNATVTITVNPVANGGGGGGGLSIGIGVRYLTVDFLGEITRGPITDDGRLMVDLDAPSPDGLHLLELDNGTKTVDSEGGVVTLIVIREIEAPPLPANTVLVGSAYDFGPSNITFSQPVRLTLSYNVTELPEDTLAVVMSYYGTEGAWVEMETESSQVAEIGSLTGITNHFTVFALFAEVTNFEVSDLSIDPSQREIWAFPTFLVRTGEEAFISINVSNNANREASYTATLWVDGEIRATREVTLTPGESKLVVFTVSGIEPGRHIIAVDGLSAEFTSSVWINWWLVGIIIAALVLIVLFTVWSYRRRGKPAE